MRGRGVAGHGYPVLRRWLIPGRYDIELRRSGINEPVATSTGHDLAAAASYTIFAVGSLRRGDIQIVIASDTP